MFKTIRYAKENDIPPVVEPVVAPLSQDTPVNDEIIGEQDDISPQLPVELVDATNELDEATEVMDDHIDAIDGIEERREVISAALESEEYSDAAVRAAGDIMRVLEEAEFPVTRTAAECDATNPERGQLMLAMEASDGYLTFLTNSLAQYFSVSWRNSIDRFIRLWTAREARIDMYEDKLNDVKTRYNKVKNHIDAAGRDIEISAAFFWSFCCRNDQLVSNYVNEFRKDSMLSKALLNDFIAERRQDIASIVRVIESNSITTDQDVIKAAKALTSAVKPLTDSDFVSDAGYDALLGNARLFVRAGKPIQFSNPAVGTKPMIELSRVVRVTERRTIAQWVMDLFKGLFRDQQLEHNTKSFISVFMRTVKPISAGDIPKLIASAETYIAGLRGYHKNLKELKRDIERLTRAVDAVPAYPKVQDAANFYRTVSRLVNTMTTACRHPGVDEYARAQWGMRSAYYVCDLVVRRAIKSSIG